MSDIEREAFGQAVTDRCSRSKTMSEEIKIRLVGAMRQFRHNFDNSTSLFNPEEGFVCAYDREVTNRIVEDLTERNRELEARVAELVSGLEGIAMCAFDYSPKSQSATQAAEWMNEEAERLMASQNSEVFIKRKQAEAVQASRQEGEPIGFLQSSGVSQLSGGHPAKLYPIGATPSPFESSTLVYTHPASSDEWIKCSERLPKESDGDCHGIVWVYNKGLSWVEISDLEDVKFISDYTHWMPTNLVRPEPPKQEEGQ